MSKHVIAAFVAAAIVSIFAVAGCGDDTGSSGCTKAEDCAPLTCNGTEFRGCVNGACVTSCDGST